MSGDQSSLAELTTLMLSCRISSAPLLRAARCAISLDHKVLRESRMEPSKKQQRELYFSDASATVESAVNLGSSGDA